MVDTAEQMKSACEKELEVDCVVCAAAVSDWRPLQVENRKIKKSSKKIPQLVLTETPDILSWVGIHKSRPRLVIGFAAETENLKINAANKRRNKNADWILANSVFQCGVSVFNSDNNEVFFVSKNNVENWGTNSKETVAKKLTDKISEYFSDNQKNEVV